MGYGIAHGDENNGDGSENSTTPENRTFQYYIIFLILNACWSDHIEWNRQWKKQKDQDGAWFMLFNSLLTWNEALTVEGKKYCRPTVQGKAFIPISRRGN